MFKRLFWPDIENQYDVDLVGQQGFWVCFAVAVITTVVSIVTGQTVLGIVIGVTYFLAGLGVRQRSVAAAVLIFSCYFLDRIFQLESTWLGLGGGGNPLVGIVATMLLFANIRATVLSRRWQAPETPVDVSELPVRSTDSLGDKLSNALPEALWPKTRYIFYPLASILLLVSVVGVISAPLMKRPRVPAKTPNTTLTVRPPQ
jgi:hypothetical protein